MRLKHIHIAGFKSFVDPVTIPATAQLTGVVGPNGCGKSNVIDAVRWVLGESKARELRGATLQDVIFNGSVGRKPASRASVELLFDNTDGKAPGQWSHYAEISVKRVLTRQGDSSYHINNVQVRKKDMADLFLGTGLGGDAYAIIEQGMISRIIDAKPEELRGFLEEAAGVSKYKERRKETEYRLRDTRENLARVADIREELARQLEKLTVQAEVARRYFALDADRTLKTRFLSLVRRRDAQVRQADLERQLEAARNEIEAKTADLRRLEAELEAQRLAQFEATEGLNTAQAGFYEASAEVARVEQELKHLGVTRDRLAQEIGLNGGRRQAVQDEIAALHAEAAQRREEQTQAEEQAEILSERAAMAGEAFPEIDAAWREAQAAVAVVQREMAQFEQAMQVEDAHRAHAERVLDQHKARELRLMQEKEALAAQDLSHVERQQMDLEALEERAASLEEYLDNARSQLPDRDIALRQARQSLDNANRDQHRIDAELAALKRMQETAQAKESEGASWLARAGLERVQRLWQTLRVEPGWETAVEAALGESMAALAAEVHDEWLEQPPEGRFEFLLPSPTGGGVGGEGATYAIAAPSTMPPLLPHPGPPPGGEGENLRSLTGLIHATPALVVRLLADRLALVFAADTLAYAVARRTELPPGGYFATREGHRVSRDTLTFNAPEKGHHGLLARAREIERLEQASDQARARQEQASVEVQRAEEALQTARRQVDALQVQIQQAHAQAGQLRAEVARGQEALKRVTERRAQVQKELDEIYDLMAAEEDAWNQAGERQYDAEQQLETARERLDAARQKRQTLDQRVQAAREAQRSAEREAQEAAFQVRALGNRIQELADRAARGEQSLQDLAREQARLQAELEQAHEAPIQDTLQAALAQRRVAETALTAARERLEGANLNLREQDAARLRIEHALEPLRERFQAMELKLQEARLSEARYHEELEGVDETALAAQAEQAGITARGDVWLRGELDRLERGITELGPVNMAALDELKVADERKQYLDAQSADLETAANTLEDAIRRIDAETRARLRATYDKVSREFQSLFMELFGGGHAELMLTGEEILDAGLTVMAQPPGKKNASIQLLSGGEKALTALSLVFAFFRLNPAPFCLLDEVDAPLDDSNTERYCAMVKKMSDQTQFLFITHNRITMEMATHLVGVTMPEPGVSRPVAVDVEDAVRMAV
ncbi:MAG: chromosome segregation protein SMC [Betaproteobacteria bacterium]|nr:chromosome segregation protein SMC [Betaproteobacteria bacterium]